MRSQNFSCGRQPKQRRRELRHHISPCTDFCILRHNTPQSMSCSHQPKRRETPTWHLSVHGCCELDHSPYSLSYLHPRRRYCTMSKTKQNPTSQLSVHGPNIAKQNPTSHLSMHGPNIAMSKTKQNPTSHLSVHGPNIAMSKTKQNPTSHLSVHGPNMCSHTRRAAHFLRRCEVCASSLFDAEFYSQL